MKFYCEFTGPLKNNVKPEGLSGSDEAVFREMLNELIAGIFASDAQCKKLIVNENKAENIIPEKIPNEDNNENTQISMLNGGSVPEGMITAPKYALRHEIKMPTMYRYLEDKKIPGAVKINGQWFMNPDAPVLEDRRKGRKMSSRSEMGMAPYMSDPKKEEYTYEELQRYIAENEGVSAHIRKFIKTFDEIKYYRTKCYKEVQVNEIDALIIDINPQYYCKRLGKNNRELIADGRAPIVADDDINRSDDDDWFEIWEVHHIGQLEDSPFAIIPITDHKMKFSKIFHVDPTPGQNLHGPNFDKQKKIFWKGYLALYDTYGGVSQIPGRHLQTIYQNLNKQKKADKK